MGNLGTREFVDHALSDVTALLTALSAAEAKVRELEAALREAIPSPDPGELVRLHEECISARATFDTCHSDLANIKYQEWQAAERRFRDYAKAALAALASPIAAPEDCPHCIDDRDCSNAPICAAVAEVYAATARDGGNR
jgi:hypothetical protein